jgi:hypothetical protein
MSEKILRATHGSPQRPLRIGNLEIPCYVLEDGTRVLSGRGMQTALTLGQRHGSLLRAFLSRNDIKPFINKDLAMALESPLRFVRPGRGGKLAVGYEATILADICDAVLAAREASALSGAGLVIAKQCEILARAFAKVGIIALVDEATGYQEIRDRYALQEILDKYIRKDLAKWAKRFPDEFYEHMFRLRGWQYRPLSVRRPGVVGHLTNDIVYARLAPGVLAEVQRLTPKDESGRRKHKFHQKLTDDVGHPALGQHLSNVIFLMKAAPNWEWFYRALQRSAPMFTAQLSLFAAEPPDDKIPELPLEA